MKKTRDKCEYVIGIDEAGRGPLAGPVAVGVCCVHIQKYKEVLKDTKKIKNKDSKKLSHKEREEWFEIITKWQKEKKIHFQVSLIDSKIIDTKGISFAIRSGIEKSLKKVTDNFKEINPEECMVLLDGSLHAPEYFNNQKTIIKGDEKEPIISLASICAKVMRDRYMQKMAKKYPEYKLEIHKGYGTVLHINLIKKHGISGMHRKSFCTNIVKS